MRDEDGERDPGPHTLTARSHPDYSWIERQREACASGNCAYANPMRDKPVAAAGDCHGWHGTIVLVGGRLASQYARCERFQAWIDATADRKRRREDAGSPHRPEPRGWT